MCLRVKAPFYFSKHHGYELSHLLPIHVVRFPPLPVSKGLIGRRPLPRPVWGSLPSDTAPLLGCRMLPLSDLSYL
jgi:hypothetical protein